MYKPGDALHSGMPGLHRVLVPLVVGVLLTLVTFAFFLNSPLLGFSIGCLSLIICFIVSRSTRNVSEVFYFDGQLKISNGYGSGVIPFDEIIDIRTKWPIRWVPFQKITPIIIVLKSTTPVGSNIYFLPKPASYFSIGDPTARFLKRKVRIYKIAKGP